VTPPWIINAQQPIFFLCSVDQQLKIFCAGGRRFFHENVLSRIEGRKSDFRGLEIRNRDEDYFEVAAFE